jgi:aminoglycoside phosphotransferase (APT) family kinase protein
MFDPNLQSHQVEQYLSKHLICQVDLIQAEELIQSSRQAPWRLDIRANGVLRSFVLQLDPHSMEHEYLVLKAMENITIPTPAVYGLDLQGKALGIPCFFSDFIEGHSLLGPVLAGDSWAEDLYIEVVCKLQAVTEEQLGDLAPTLERETVKDVLEGAYAFLKDQSIPIAETTYQVLKSNIPIFPQVCFSNGDLWLDNFIVNDHMIAAVIDFANACYSDPLYEFLLSFFVSLEIQGRGIEERYCQKIGVDPAVLHWYHGSVLHWYHGLEYFDTLRWVLITGQDFVHHSTQSLQESLRKWLDGES